MNYNAKNIKCNQKIRVKKDAEEITSKINSFEHRNYNVETIEQIQDKTFEVVSTSFRGCGIIDKKFGHIGISYETLETIDKQRDEMLDIENHL